MLSCLIDANFMQMVCMIAGEQQTPVILRQEGCQRGSRTPTAARRRSCRSGGGGTRSSTNESGGSFENETRGAEEAVGRAGQWERSWWVQQGDLYSVVMGRDASANITNITNITATVLYHIRANAGGGWSIGRGGFGGIALLSRKSVRLFSSISHFWQ